MWGQGLAGEAVTAVITWWAGAASGAGPVVAVTQKTNTVSCRLLESIGMTLIDEFAEYGAQQCLYGFITQRKVRILSPL